MVHRAVKIVLVPLICAESPGKDIKTVLDDILDATEPFIIVVCLSHVRAPFTSSKPRRRSLSHQRASIDAHGSTLGFFEV